MEDVHNEHLNKNIQLNIKFFWIYVMRISKIHFKIFATNVSLWFNLFHKILKEKKNKKQLYWDDKTQLPIDEKYYITIDVLALFTHSHTWK